jgi:hypothetical protein
MRRGYNERRLYWDNDLGEFVSADGRSYWDKGREVFVLLSEESLRQLDAKKGRKQQKYFHIPINGWLRRASKLPGNIPLLVAIAVVHEVNLEGGKSVTFSDKLLDVFGIGAGSKHRGLEALEKAGLIKVERRLGANPVVTMLAVKPGGGDERFG